MDCPRTINVSILLHVVVANQALQENTKVRGPGVEGSKLRCRVQVKVQSALSTKVSRATSLFHTEGGGGGGGGGEGRGDVPSPKVRSPPKKILQIN